MRSRIHANRIAGTGFHAKATVDTPQGIDLVANRILLDGVVWIFSRLDVDTFCGTGGGAQKTGRALNRAVILQRQTVTPAESFRIRRSFVGILNSNRRLNTARQAEL